VFAFIFTREHSLLSNYPAAQKHFHDDDDDDDATAAAAATACGLSKNAGELTFFMKC
jgi:hypothetical protein